MPIQKDFANKVLTTLDTTANTIDSLAKAGKIDPRVASQITKDIDSFSDRFQVAAFGEKSLSAHQSKVAKVIKQDADEAYMKTFENPIKPITTDADEPYMHKAEHGYNSTKDEETFDADRSSSVHDRNEYAVRDLNEFAEGTKKQPSWDKGPAGKSTKQGSAAPRTAKTWAP